MAAEFDVVDVFVGRFGSKKALDRYLEEAYDEADDAPISAFAKDLGQTFYDHDLVESAYRKSAKTFQALCSDLSYAESWLEPAREAYLLAGIAPPNTALIAFGATLDRPKSVSGPGYELEYLGRFSLSASSSLSPETGPSTICYLEFPPGIAFVNGQPATIIPIPPPGATLGQGGAPGVPGLYIDLPSTPLPLAPEQARLYPDPFGQWTLEDLAANDATLYRGQPFNRSKALPWHEIQFSLGGIPVVFLAWER